MLGSIHPHIIIAFSDLIGKWEQLDAEVLPLHQEGLQQRQLQQQVQTVRNKLLELETFLLAIGVDGDFQLNLNKIQQIKSLVEAEKDSLLQVNVDVHSCVAQQTTAVAGVNLKEDVAGLYQMWERLVMKASEKETILEEAEKTWKEFQEQLLNLKAEIAADQRKVKTFINLQSTDASCLPTTAPGCPLDSPQSKAKLFSCIMKYSVLMNTQYPLRFQLDGKLEQRTTERTVRFRNFIRLGWRVYFTR